MSLTCMTGIQLRCLYMGYRCLTGATTTATAAGEMRVVVQFGLSSAQGSQITRQLQLQLNYDCLPQQHAINNSVNLTALPLQSEGQ